MLLSENEVYLKQPPKEMVSHYQGKTCLSGGIYNYLLKEKVEFYEFDFVLNKNLEMKYCCDGKQNFEMNIWRPVSCFFDQYNIRMIKDKNQNALDSISRLRVILKKNPVFLFVKANMLKYNSAFRYARDAKHIICVTDYRMGKYYVADSYISNAPLTSFYGWVDECIIHKAWSELEYESFYLDCTSSDLVNINKNRVDNIRVFFENNIYPSSDNKVYYGIYAKKRLLYDTIDLVKCDVDINIEKYVFTLSYHLRASLIIGIMQLIEDSFEWFQENYDFEFWNGCKNKIASIIESWIKELLVCTKMALRRNRESVLNSLECMCNLVDDELLLYELVLKKIELL